MSALFASFVGRHHELFGFAAHGENVRAIRSAIKLCRSVPRQPQYDLSDGPAKGSSRSFLMTRKLDLFARGNEEENSEEFN